MRKNSKNWFFEKSNKIKNPLVRLPMNKWEKTQIRMSEMKEVHQYTDPVDIKRRIKEYYEHLYACKFDN